MTSDTPPVTVLGLGQMGTALAGALIARGHPTTVWNRSPERAQPLLTRGATAAASPADALAASPLTILCLVDNAAVRETLGGAAAALDGRVLVNLTNGTPGQARQLDGWVRAHGARYLDGGIMAVPPMIGGPHAFVFYSGAAGTFAAHRETLAAFGEARHVGEDPGLAAVWDLALLSGMYGMFAGAMHAVALARGADVAPTALMPALEAWLEAMQSTLPELAEQVERGEHPTTSPLAMQAAGFANLVDAGHELGVRPDLLLPLGALMEEAVAAGHGDEDLSAAVELLARPRLAA